MGQRQMKIHNSSPRSSALRIAGLYLLMALVWILASDSLLNQLSLPRTVEQGLQSYKGIGFVIVTAIGLWWICARRFKQILTTQRRLEEKQRMFDTLVSNLPGTAYRCLADEHRSMLFVSDGFEPLTGYPPGDLDAGRITYNQVIHPDDRRQMREAIEKAVRLKTCFRLESRMPSPA